MNLARSLHAGFTGTDPGVSGTPFNPERRPALHRYCTTVALNLRVFCMCVAEMLSVFDDEHAVAHSSHPFRPDVARTLSIISNVWATPTGSVPVAVPLHESRMNSAHFSHARCTFSAGMLSEISNGFGAFCVARMLHDLCLLVACFLSEMSNVEMSYFSSHDPCTPVAYSSHESRRKHATALCGLVLRCQSALRRPSVPAPGCPETS